jgi:uncharacterized protein (DUF1778 family)
MMPATKRTPPKNERLEARVSSETKALFQEAASHEGCSLTDFVIHSAIEAAKRTLRDRNIMELSQRDQAAFVEALFHPPLPNTRLQQAAQHYEQVFGQ